MSVPPPVTPTPGELPLSQATIERIRQLLPFNPNVFRGRLENDRARIDQFLNLSVATGAFTAILASSKTRYDNHGIVSGASLICRRRGGYAISAGLTFDVPAGGLQRILRILVNGLAIAEQTLVPIPGGASGTFQTVNTQYELVIGDVVTFDCYQDSGGAINVLGTNVLGGGTPLTFGAMMLVAP